METLARLRGPYLPVATCMRRLGALGARTSSPRESSSTDLLEHLVIDTDGTHPSGPDSLDCQISWHGPALLAHDLAANEATVQARCGLMEVHGRDAGHPRRLGIEAASVAAGLLATQGLLAALIGQSRGITVGPVQTSVLQAGLMLVSHYVAAATCPPLTPTPSGSAPGPPFASAGGPWFEIETLDPEAWKGFWGDLGVEGPDLGRAWTAFRRRYFEGRCSFPPGLHEATAKRPFSEIRQLAQQWRVSLIPLRHLADVLVDPGRSGAANRLGGLEELPGLIPGASLSSGHSLGPDLPPNPELPLNPKLPLTGLKVVEATSRMQGPLAGLLLQMLGAEVLHVEPKGGDVGRMTLPLAGDTGSFFLAFNRHKQTIELDLNTPSGRASLRDLTAKADVFLANWRPGKAAEWELDVEDLARGNPRLVHARASGWGDRPENLSVLGTDFLVQAFAGVADAVSPDTEPAAPSRVLLTDFM
ncbi:MAG: CoA transferase, partial [Pseudonocardiaceae bacterium]